MPSRSLLERVHARIGGVGVDIRTFGDGSLEIRWRRSYGKEGLSDERLLQVGPADGGIMAGLRGILAYEYEADREDELEGVEDA